MQTDAKTYYDSKAKKMFELYKQNLPCKKVYGVVEKDNQYMVLYLPNKKYKYQLSGGGVEENETNSQALERELLEELNVNVEIIKSLGNISYVRTWEYEGKSFDVNYQTEIFYTKFVSFAKNKKMGIQGEFDNSIKMMEISKQEMLDNVAEFALYKLKLN